MRSLSGIITVLKLAVAGALPGSAAADVPAQDLAGDYLIRRFDMEHGLPENSATAFAQTADGYLWFGTFGGLVRFDGTECEVFNTANVPAMKSAGIVNLYLDARQRLWVSTYKGLLIREGEGWRRLGPEEGWTGDYARSLAGRPNGDVLITDFQGRVFESTGGSVRELPAQPGEQNQGCIGGVDEEGHWWVVQRRFTGRLEDGRWLEKLTMSEVNRDSIGCGQARGGGLWILLGRELRRFQRGVENARIPLPELAGGFWSLTEDSRGFVWIATHNKGICRVAPNGTLTRWDEASGGTNHGRAVFEDREGNLWLGTSGDGLAWLSPRRFRQHEILPEQRGLQVQSVCLRQAGGLWLATYRNGLFRMDAGGEARQEVIPDPEQAMNFLHTALEDRSGRLWLGTMNQGLRFWQNNTVSPHPEKTEAGHDPAVLFEDARGRLWAASVSAVAVRENEQWRTLGADHGLPAGGAAGIAEDSTGVIWLAHTAGVFRMGPEEKASPLLVDGTPVTGISALLAGEAGTMWLASGTRGLLRWKSGRLVKVPGLPVNGADGLVGDANGSLWMTSTRRLIRVSQEKLHGAAEGGASHLDCEVFDASDGLPAAEFIRRRQPSAACDPAGRLWFAMNKGVLMVDPAMLRRNVLPPPVEVQRLRYHLLGSRPEESGATVPNGDSAEERRGPFPEVISLPPGSRRLEIHYAALRACLAKIS
ncbi:MAG: Sensory box histidine kinase/response regulator [Verrucomicrobiales bacterium]|nr:Sensory box histidine kinase/response regulator [Verrucomicrobiales bacterium]